MRLARANVHGAALDGEVVDGAFVAGGERHSLDSVQLLSPVDAGRLLLILGGYGARAPGSEPRLTPKLVSEVGGDGAVLVVPEYATGPLWMEVELAVVIGSELSRASVQEARAAILGFSCFNDASVPEALRRERPDYFRAKSIETLASMGPWIDTGVSEQDVIDGLRLTAHVNGELKAEGNTRDLRFTPSEVISFVSAQLTLRRGDVIALGTPQPCEASFGDEVELTVEGIGTLHNRVGEPR